MQRISEKTVGRLILYRRILTGLEADGARSVYSHELAGLTGSTAAQVRRDLMAIDYSGSPKRGYDVKALLAGLGRFLDVKAGQRAVLVGVGNLGRAILRYFSGRRPNLKIVAGFDADPAKASIRINGCPCHGMAELPRVVRKERVDVGVVTVPVAAAQEVADRLVAAGILGILNFAPVTLSAPPEIFVEDMDMAVALEKVAYFSRRGARPK